MIPAFYNDWGYPDGKYLPGSYSDISSLSVAIFQTLLLYVLAVVFLVRPNTPVYPGLIAVFFPHLFVMLVPY